MTDSFNKMFLLLRYIITSL